MGVKGNVRNALKELRKRHVAGLEAAVQRIERQYRSDVTSRQATPVVVDGRVVGFRGDSKLGEYPVAETFQGADNIASVVDRDSLEGRAGVRGEDGIGPRDPTHDKAGGLHIALYLADNSVFGGSGKPGQGRKGIIHSVMENLESVRDSYRNASEKS